MTQSLIERADTAAGPAHPEILRFRPSERRLHWALAVPYLVCLVTALVLFGVYNLHPERPFRAAFSWIHRLSAVALIALPPLTLARHRDDAHVYWSNVREAYSWTRDDFKWLLLIGPASVSRRVTLPHQGKFNAAEKVNFITLTLTYPLFIATGLSIWIWKGSLVSWLLHMAMAFSAMPLILGHLFMAIVNPDTRVGLEGMFSGYVNRAWARHHYRRWYDAHHAASVPSPEPVVAAEGEQAEGIA